MNDILRRIKLCKRALEMVNRSSHPKLWADLQNALAYYLLRNQMGKFRVGDLQLRAGPGSEDPRGVPGGMGNDPGQFWECVPEPHPRRAGEELGTSDPSLLEFAAVNASTVHL